MSAPPLQPPELHRVLVCDYRGRLGRMLSWLDAGEVVRAGRFVHVADQEVYVASHGRLRELLAAECGCAPQALRFVRGPFGKPALCPSHGRPLLRFSLSHTRGCAMIALARDGSEAGVDIEAVQRFDDMSGARSLFLSPGECERLAAMDQVQARLRLARTWTAKEAYAKAEGSGLALGFPTVEVDMGRDAQFSLRPVAGSALPLRPMLGSWEDFTAVDGTAYSVAAVVLGAAGARLESRQPRTCDCMRHSRA